MLALAAGSLAFLGTVRASASEEPVVLIVSRDWRGPDALGVPLLRKLYLGRRSQLDGRRIRCFDLPAGHPVRRGFTRSVLQMTDAELEEYWIEQALTGGALPPREVGSADEMVEAVARERGAVGYLDSNTFRRLRPATVRILGVLVAGRALQPGDDGYPVHYPSPRGSRDREAGGSEDRSRREIEPPPVGFMGPSWRFANYPLGARRGAAGGGTRRLVRAGRWAPRKAPGVDARPGPAGAGSEREGGTT